MSRSRDGIAGTEVKGTKKGDEAEPSQRADRLRIGFANQVGEEGSK